VTVNSMDQLRLSGAARTGDVLGGRYRLEELIGEGGMASVWRAFDTALGRTVAVKVFWSGAADDSDAARRESEKKLLASVSHPSLVTLFDAHLSTNELSYLVMEHIDGGTLSSVINEGPVAMRDAASLAADLGEALHVIHRAGIIHRDIKPANILLRPPLTDDHTFRAVLADFGIAYVMDAARVTTPGMAMGTAAYIAPEQVRGHAPTPASDIYSLGLVLLEALSGRRAFEAQTPVEAISVRLTASPEIPGDWGYGWRSLLTAMTALDPDARPTALEVSRRGRALDTPDAQPAPTRAVPLAAGEGTDRTKLLVPAVAATALMALPASSSPATRRAFRSGRQASALCRRRGVIGTAALGVAGIAIALAAWGGTAASTPPTDAPQVEQPAPTEPAPAMTVESVEPTSEPVVSDTQTDVDDAGSDAGGSGSDSGGSDAGGPDVGNGNSGPGNNNGNGSSGAGNGNGNSGPGNNNGNGRNG
jgi:eukaryotic-like serine/threonine-protein kinase